MFEALQKKLFVKFAAKCILYNSYFQDTFYEQLLSMKVLKKKKVGQNFIESL